MTADAARGLVAVSMLLFTTGAAVCQDVPSRTRYQALRCPTPSAASTWAVLRRDGAGREVDPYLSSLAGGEAGTGKIVSPEFEVTGAKISFTVCGHDGLSGGSDQNFIALIDSATGETLAKTVAPGSDSLQERSWDTSRLQGRQARIEVHDGIAAGAFAWLGIGTIEAGSSLKVDFRQGLPDGWTTVRKALVSRPLTVTNGIPFRRESSVYTLMPEAGMVEIPCGFTAERLFFLGCTVARGKPLEQYGTIEVIYASGARHEIPLIYGFTLDGEGKLLSPSHALFLHPSGDCFQHYLAVQPREEQIQSIRMRRDPEREYVPRITAITCQTAETAETLTELPESKPTADEEAWLRTHTLPLAPDQWPEIEAQIRRDHRTDS